MAMMPYGWPGRRRRSQDMQTFGTPQEHFVPGVGSCNVGATRMARRCNWNGTPMARLSPILI
jgi:hypothetical protein